MHDRVLAGQVPVAGQRGEPTGRAPGVCGAAFAFISVLIVSITESALTLHTAPYPILQCVPLSSLPASLHLQLK